MIEHYAGDLVEVIEDQIVKIFGRVVVLDKVGIAVLVQIGLIQLIQPVLGGVEGGVSLDHVVVHHVDAGIGAVDVALQRGPQKDVGIGGAVQIEDGDVLLGLPLGLGQDVVVRIVFGHRFRFLADGVLPGGSSVAAAEIPERAEQHDGKEQNTDQTLFHTRFPPFFQKMTAAPQSSRPRVSEAPAPVAPHPPSPPMTSVPVTGSGSSGRAGSPGLCS